MGIIANIIAGLVGSTIGQAILGTWGPSLWDGYCAIDYRGSDFSCHRFMDFRTKIESLKIGHKSFRLMSYFSFL